MASYQILHWGDIPTGVRARDEDGTATEHLHDRFQMAVDAVATATSKTGTEEYLAEWSWSDWLERNGDAAQVAGAVAAELEQDIAPPRLREIQADLIERLGRPETAS